MVSGDGEERKIRGFGRRKHGVDKGNVEKDSDPRVFPRLPRIYQNFSANYSVLKAHKHTGGSLLSACGSSAFPLFAKPYPLKLLHGKDS